MKPVGRFFQYAMVVVTILSSGLVVPPRRRIR